MALSDTTKVILAVGGGVLFLGVVAIIMSGNQPAAAPQQQFTPTGTTPTTTTDGNTSDVATGLRAGFGAASDITRGILDLVNQREQRAQTQEQLTFCRTHPDNVTCRPAASNGSNSQPSSANRS